MQKCAGCDVEAPHHPIIGVTRDPETGRMSAFPICHRCWVDPSNRKRTLKMHFFDPSMEQQAVRDAENNILVSMWGPDGP